MITTANHSRESLLRIALRSRLCGPHPTLPPGADFLSQIIIFGLEFQDRYEDPAVESNAAAVGVARIKPTSVVLAALFVAAALLCIFAWVLVKRIAARKARVVKERQVQKSVATMEKVAETLAASLQREHTRGARAARSSTRTNVLHDDQHATTGDKEFAA